MSDEDWLRIEQELMGKPPRSIFKSRNEVPKVVELDPYKNKYKELNDIYRNEYGHNDGSSDCDRLLEDIRAFERVFNIMKR